MGNNTNWIGGWRSELSYYGELEWNVRDSNTCVPIELGLYKVLYICNLEIKFSIVSN